MIFAVIWQKSVENMAFNLTLQLSSVIIILLLSALVQHGYGLTILALLRRA